MEQTISRIASSSSTTRIRSTGMANCLTKYANFFQWMQLYSQKQQLTLSTIPEYMMNLDVVYSKRRRMMHVTTVVSWLGMCLPTAWLHMGPWALTLGLLFTALLVYIGFRERYLFIWLAGWGCLLLSRGAMNSTALANHYAALALEKILFVLAITLLSASALYYTDSRRYLAWIGVLGSLDVCVAAAHAIWFPSSYPVLLCFQILYHSIALVAALRLALFAIGRMEFGPWLFGTLSAGFRCHRLIAREIVLDRQIL